MNRFLSLRGEGWMLGVFDPCSKKKHRHHFLGSTSAACTTIAPTRSNCLSGSFHRPALIPETISYHSRTLPTCSKKLGMGREAARTMRVEAVELAAGGCVGKTRSPLLKLEPTVSFFFSFHHFLFLLFSPFHHPTSLNNFLLDFFYPLPFTPL